MKRQALQLAAICSLAFTLNASAVVLYVDLNSTSPTSPYTNWGTAATNIQDAVNAANPGDKILVTNGIYQTFGRFLPDPASRVVINKAVTVQSANGPTVTVIQGYQVPGTTNGTSAVRCAYLNNGATLSGFTLTNGATLQYGSGGGVCCQSTNCMVTNCVIVGNAAYGSGAGACSGTMVNCILAGNTASKLSIGNGGGAYNSVLVNCLLTGNQSGYVGGAAAWCTLVNCTVVSNSAAAYNGSLSACTAKNSIVYYNFNYYTNADVSDGGCSYTNCCTSFAVTFSGANNFTNPPGFVNLAGGDFHLQIGSPCINAGDNAFAPVGADLDGNPRIVGGTVDLGAYENQNTNTVHYVSLSSANPVTPYTNWITAATNIQDAVGTAMTGDFVVADAGVYSVGGTVVYGQETNRVALTNAVTLLSIYGPQLTIIVGGTQMRCVYVGSNAALSGFTITNGQTKSYGDVIKEQSGGGVWCETSGMVSNSIISGNSAGSDGGGGGAYGGTFYNCTLTNNAGPMGGGVSSGILWNCTLARNNSYSSEYCGGGGAYSSTLYNCTLSSNFAYAYVNGGGACQCVLSNCVLMGNATTFINGGASGSGGGSYGGINYNCLFLSNISSNAGGGSYQSTNYNCVLTGNMAYSLSGSSGGGGACGGWLCNCVLSSNTVGNIYSSGAGGGAYGATLVNCTVTGNTATNSGGGIYGGAAYNSIIYFNSAPSGSNWAGTSQLFFCCVTNPLFVDAASGDFRLKCGSPCIDAGAGYYFAPTNDIRGVLRPLDGNGDGIAQYDIGAYEYSPAIDPIPVIRAAFSFTNLAANYPLSLVAEIGGCADYFWWDFGDGVTVTNQSLVSHAWAAPGTYNVLLTAYYSSLGYGLSATTQVQVVQQPVYYADVNSPNPTPPYTNWTTAARTIQQAIAAGTMPGRLVLVADGGYSSGGVIVYGNEYNAMALTNPVVVQSVNGPGATTIQPYQGRCAYVGNNAILSGFTLMYGQALSGSGGDIYKELSGGGVWCEPGGVAATVWSLGMWPPITAAEPTKALFTIACSPIIPLWQTRRKAAVFSGARSPIVFWPVIGPAITVMALEVAQA